MHFIVRGIAECVCDDVQGLNNSQPIQGFNKLRIIQNQFSTRYMFQDASCNNVHCQ